MPEVLLIMDVHPSFNIDPQGPTTAEPFAPEALYEIKIDTNGDAVADIANRARSASSKGGAADRSTLAAGRTCTLTVGFAVIAAEGDALEGLRRCAARRARRLPGRARAGRLSSRERRSRRDGRHRRRRPAAIASLRADAGSFKGVGHNVPQEAPEAFAKSSSTVIDPRYRTDIFV